METNSGNLTVRKTLTDCSSLTTHLSNSVGDEGCGEFSGPWVKVLGLNDSSTTTFSSSFSFNTVAWTLQNFALEKIKTFY